MLERENNLFYVQGSRSCAAIVVRMLDTEQRIPQTDGKVFISESLSPNEAWDLMLNDSNAMLIDVRTNEEYKIGHIYRSICISLNDIFIHDFNPDCSLTFLLGQKDITIYKK